VDRAHSRYLRSAEVCAYAGIAKSTLYDHIKKGNLPAGIRLSRRVVVWDRQAVDEALGRLRGSRG
jgi:predicted DNA-binding transcriptional regulator AlpA